MDYKLSTSLLSIFIAILLIIQNTVSFNPIRFHCSNYVLNSYLYLFLSFAIIFSTVFGLQYSNMTLTKLFAGKNTFLLLIVSIFLVSALIMLNPKYFFTKHVLWIVYIALMGVFLYPIYKENNTLFYHSSLTTFAIVLLLTGITYVKPDIIKNSWFMPLFLVTVGLLIGILGESFLASRGIRYQSKTKKIISYATIGIFSLWMLYDTKQIIRNAENCVNPDYINQSMNILLDTLNIFTGVAGARSS